MPAIGLATGSVLVSTNASALSTSTACTAVIVQGHISNTVPNQFDGVMVKESQPRVRTWPL